MGPERLAAALPAPALPRFHGQEDSKGQSFDRPDHLGEPLPHQLALKTDLPLASFTLSNNFDGTLQDHPPFPVAACQDAVYV